MITIGDICWQPLYQLSLLTKSRWCLMLQKHCTVNWRSALWAPRFSNGERTGCVTEKADSFSREMPGTLQANYLWDGHLFFMGASGSYQSHLRHAGGGPAPWSAIYSNRTNMHGVVPGLGRVTVQTHHLMNLRKPWKEFGVLVGIGWRLQHMQRRVLWQD